jgi:hypothetical protein
MAKNSKFEKIKSKCEVCQKPIRIFQESEHLCKKHYEEKHKDDFSKLADFIMNGHA